MVLPSCEEIRAVPESKFAETLFVVTMLREVLEDKLYDNLAVIFNCGTDYPFDDLTWDNYDYSLELRGCRKDLTVTPEQANKIRALGFSRFWLNWSDGTELYVYWEQGELHIGERRKR